MQIYIDTRADIKESLKNSESIMGYVIMYLGQCGAMFLVVCVNNRKAVHYTMIYRQKVFTFMCYITTILLELYIFLYFYKLSINYCPAGKNKL